MTIYNAGNNEDADVDMKSIKSKKSLKSRKKKKKIE